MMHAQVQAHTQVYLNGVLLGGHESGYTPYRFRIDGTAGNNSLKYSGDNVLAVFVDATHPDGWWYDGGGIYRYVHHV
jgi:beta-galactosidase